jgi:hypothetical protein
MAGRFVRIETRRRVRGFLLGLLADLPRKNCWAIAEHAGDPDPHGMQYLLARASWDTDGVSDDLRDYVTWQLGDTDAALVVDETGDEKKGVYTVGVQRQYTGTAGRIENAQVAVYLVYAGERGHAFIDRELYLPTSWTSDPERCAAAGVPEDIDFLTKPALATGMIIRALNADVPARWVAGDEVYGAGPGLRAELELRRVGYVLGIGCDRRVPTAAGPLRADEIAAGLPRTARQRLSAGAGAKGSATTTGPADIWGQLVEKPVQRQRVPPLSSRDVLRVHLRNIGRNLPGVSRHFPARRTPHREASLVTPDLTIVGAGLTGLTAAIEAAEQGWRVTVAEAHSRPGGRARSLAAPFRANTGPHAIYVDGPWWAWLERRGLTPPIVRVPRRASLVRAAGRLAPWPAELSEAIVALPAEAPKSESFRAWLLRHVDATTAEAIIGVAFVTFDHDPGRLSAAFARQCLRRALAGGARYVVGGWSTLVDLLTERAASLGVQICTRTRLPAVPDGPTILATSLATARQLTGDSSLSWPSARVVTIDLGLRADGGPGWFRVVDLDDRIYVARYSRADPTLAPPRHELIQIAAACAPHERKADAERRVQRLLDQSWPGWRTAVQWQRSAVRVHCTGAIDMPGTTWHDRPAVRRSNTLTVATDQSAAPGLLAEVGIAAAQVALQQFGESPMPAHPR